MSCRLSCIERGVCNMRPDIGCTCSVKERLANANYFAPGVIEATRRPNGLRRLLRRLRALLGGGHV